MARLGDEGAADALAFLAADRDVLQVGLGGGQPAGAGIGHREIGMDAAGARVDLRGQPIHVGGFQLRELAPVEHRAGERHVAGGQFLEHRGIGAPGAGLALAAAGELHLVEQDLAQLLG